MGASRQRHMAAERLGQFCQADLQVYGGSTERPTVFVSVLSMASKAAGVRKLGSVGSSSALPSRPPPSGAYVAEGKGRASLRIPLVAAFDEEATASPPVRLLLGDGCPSAMSAAPSSSIPAVARAVRGAAVFRLARGGGFEADEVEAGEEGEEGL